MYFTEMMRSIIVEAGGVKALVGLLSGHPSIQSHAILSLINLSREGNLFLDIVC